MNMFGLDGSGFLISVCLTLLLSGMIVFYVRQALAENSHKMQAIMSIVQDLNTKNMVNMPHPVNNQVNNEILSTHPISNHLDTIPEEISLGGGDNKIDVSDDSDENSTTEDNIESDEEDDEDEDNEDDNNEVNSKENTDNNTLQVSDEQQDDVKKITMSEDVTEYEELKIDELNDITQNVLNETDSDDDEDKLNVTEANLDNMLLNMINNHSQKKSEDSDTHIVELNQEPNYNDLKVNELRQLVRDKGLKITNVSKLKKNECIQLLSE